MFDVKPIKESGGLDFEKISQVRTKINLREEPAVPQPAKPVLIERQIIQPQVIQPQAPAVAVEKADQPLPDQKILVLREFEDVFLEPVNAIAELARAGAQIHPLVRQRSKPRFIARVVTAEVRKDKEKVVETLPPKTPQMLPAKSPEPKRVLPNAVATTLSTPVSREVDFWLARAGTEKDYLHFPPPKRKSKNTLKFKFKLSSFFGKKFLISFFGLVFTGALIWWAAQSGIWAKNNIVQNGSNAVANLEDAKQKLEDFKFQDAANSFALAYDDLNKASGTLNEFGASFLSVFGNLPGLGKLNAANNLVEAGRNISKAGENLASALGTLYSSNPLSFLNGQAPSTGSGQAGSKSFSELLGNFKAVLVSADRNVKKAGSLLADIDASVIPADKQPLLLDFKERIPQFQEYIGNAINYSDFLLKLVGGSGKKTYLVLLQNNSELRPTGGFPGTYALITFENGYLNKIFVDDIYQIDANLKENIIPPIQMQHITPTWGMRDANWFTDFPASARKVEEFYQKDGGGKVDGVLAITPDVIADMLKIIGPIDMPEYGLKLGADNFLAEIQNEVEYEADRSKPKKILTDLQPKFFEKLGEQDKNNWIEIFKIITKAAEEKHMLAYFDDPNLEKTAVENGLGGEVKQFAGDFLEIVFANVKGSKTDFVTDSSFNLGTSQTGDGSIEHELTISRLHNGGSSQYGFYNRDNSTYVKVFVPEGSVLESVVGQSITDFTPLISYDGFKRDSDLARIEGNVSHPVGGVDVSEESGKTVFGFWLIVKPKQTKSVVLKYHTPAAGATGEGYALYWQKQSGTGGDHINFSFKLPDGSSVTDKSPGLQRLGDNLVLNSDLTEDRSIDIMFK